MLLLFSLSNISSSSDKYYSEKESEEFDSSTSKSSYAGTSSIFV